MSTIQRYSSVLALFLVMFSLSGRVGQADTPNAAVRLAAGISATKLLPRDTVDPAKAAGKFVQLAPDRTDIDFVHRWQPPPHDYDFRTLLLGGAVCIGDYDGDALPDIYLTRPDGGNRLFRNLGDFRFRDVTVEAGLVDKLWGMGATFVDIDNDGDLDIYACAFQSPNRLYINLGNGQFEERAAKFGLDFAGASIMLAVADYDNDGHLDGYLVTNRQQPTDHARFAQIAKQGFHVDPKRKTAYYDKQLRELLDVIIFADGKTIKAHHMMAGQRDRLYHNTGRGTFEEVGGASIGIEGNDIGLAAIWWDYNADRLPDLYVANDFLGPDRLYRNDGDGSFTDVARQALPHTPWSSMGADAADLNNDGRLDFMGSDMSSSSHYRDKVTMGDMSSMGWFLEWANPRQYMRNAVYLNSGTPRFMEIAHQTGLSQTDWTWSVKCADLDDDGRVDVYITNGMTRDWENADIVAEVDQRGGYDSPAGLQFWLDQPLNSQENLAFRNQGDLQFEAVGAAWGLDHLGVSFGAALGDLDGDGDLDLVTNHHQQPVGIYRNQVSTGHRIKIRLVGRASNRWGIGATVRLENADGQQVRYLTLARGFMSSDEPLVHFGLGDNESIDRLTVDWPSGRQQLFEDLAVDQFYTITEPESGAEGREAEAPQPTMYAAPRPIHGAIHRDDPYDDYAQQPLLPAKLSQSGPGMAWGDLNNDGLDDLYLSGGVGYAGVVCRNLGQGEFQTIPEPMAGATDQSGADQAANDFDHAQCEDMGALIFDVDADGDCDLYVVSGGVEHEVGDVRYRDRLYLNDGDGQLSAAPPDALPDLRDSGGPVCAADFDRDGDLDLFVGGRVVPGQYPAMPQSRLLRNDSGPEVASKSGPKNRNDLAAKFSEVTSDVAPELAETGLVTSAIWSDADGDGWLDLLVTHEWGPVKLFRNEQGRLVDRTSAAGLSGRLGWYNGIAAGDLDGDEDIDYVVTNVGLNTKYHATPAEPARIYYGDFAGTGEMQIVEAKTKGGDLLPVRGKSCSQNAMPFVRQRFPKYHDFASALLPEIYTPQCLNDALSLEANSFESGVLINDGQAHFTFHPLPPIAQIAPGFGVAITEVNGDARPDIYLVQNSFSPQRETGRMDGGVSMLLLGRGDGTFEPVWPSDSGLVVPHDAKSLVVTDVNGDRWPDFVVGANGRPVEAFCRRPAAGRQIVVVKLKRGGVERLGIGARVTVELSSGNSQTREFGAGGGYLSQSSAALTFGLPAAESLSRVRIVWPDGEETVQEATNEFIAIDVVTAKQP